MDSFWKKALIMLAVISPWIMAPASCGGPGSGREEAVSAAPACVKAPDGFTSLSEIRGVRIDVRYATSNNFTGEVLDGYRAPCAWLVAPAAEALGMVQEDLARRGYGLKVFDAYRPLRAQRHMIRWAHASGKPWLIGTYISGAVNAEAVYGHPCGNTVDLTLTGLDGNELDMGGDFDEFTERAWTKNAAGPAREHRTVLREAMERRGFKNYHMEWWHYTFMRPSKARDIPVE